MAHPNDKTFGLDEDKIKQKNCIVCIFLFNDFTKVKII